MNPKKCMMLGMMIFMAGIPLLGATTTATQGDGTPALKASKEAVDERYQKAQSLYREGKAEEAFQAFLWVFDNSRAIPAYGGVRLSYLIKTIANLGTGELNVRAVQALKDRRTAAEKNVLDGRGDFTDLQEYHAISKQLSEAEASMALYTRLKVKGAETAEIRGKFMIILWQDFVKAKNYGELNDSIVEIAKRIASDIDRLKTDQDFPTDEKSTQFAGLIAWERSNIRETGSSAFETSLALKRSDVADPLKRRLLEFQSDESMYAALIQAALKAGDKAQARALYAKAKESIPESERATLLKFEEQIKE